MSRLLVIAILASASLETASLAERALMQVYQPTSLLGTDSEDDPLGTGEWIAATIVSRPVIIGGAFPESPVHAISLPHRISGAPPGFPEESNLIVIVGADVRAQWGREEDRIIADFSKARMPENLGVTLIQVMKMTALCLQKTIGTRHEKPIKIRWIAPEGVSLIEAALPTEIQRIGKQDGSGGPAARSKPGSEGGYKTQSQSKGPPQ